VPVPVAHGWPAQRLESLADVQNRRQDTKAEDRRKEHPATTLCLDACHGVALTNHPQRILRDCVEGRNRL
jgi:hypothetical protein